MRVTMQLLGIAIPGVPSKVDNAVKTLSATELDSKGQGVQDKSVAEKKPEVREDKDEKDTQLSESTITQSTASWIDPAVSSISLCDSSLTRAVDDGVAIKRPPLEDEVDNGECKSIKCWWWVLCPVRELLSWHSFDWEKWRGSLGTLRLFLDFEFGTQKVLVWPNTIQVTHILSESFPKWLC